MQFKFLAAQAIGAMTLVMLAGAQTTVFEDPSTTTDIITDPTTTTTDDSTTTTPGPTDSPTDSPTESPTDSTSSDSLMTPTITDSLNITMTSTTTLPTATGFPNETIADGDLQDWPYGGEFVKPYAPEPVQDDAKLIELLYLANLNQTACEQKAESYSSTPAFRKRAEAVLNSDAATFRKRSNHKRSLIPVVCLPAWETVDVTFHWLLSSTTPRADFVLSAQLDDQINDLALGLARMRIAINVKGRWVWTGADIDKATIWDKTKAEQNAGILGSMKRKLGTDVSDHLNIFLVDRVLRDDGASIGGICAFPLRNKVVEEHDGCIVATRTMRNHPNPFGGRQGALMIHEVGHWFNLEHPHDGGCSGSDGLTDTKQFPVAETGYSQKACLNTAGNLEATASPVYNFMSYSTSANVDEGFFSREQIAAAHVGLRVYRRGLRSAACPAVLGIRGTTAPLSGRDASDEPISIDHLIRRQESLTSICNNTQLRISNLEVSDWAVQGLNNPNSPPFTPPFTQIPADTSVVVPPKPQSPDAGKMGVIQAPNVKDFVSYPGNQGPGSTGSSQDTVGTGTNGGKGTSGLGGADVSTTGTGTGTGTGAGVVRLNMPGAGIVGIVGGFALMLVSLL